VTQAALPGLFSLLPDLPTRGGTCPRSAMDETVKA